MAQKRELVKPKFVKVKDLQTHRSGFNVYVKVISAEPRVIDTKEGLKIPMVDCILADETGSAKAFFKGDVAQIIQKGNVIAIRNGLKRFIKDKISLEIDLFGRVTLEKDVNITPAEAEDLNISNAEHKLEDKRGNRQNRRPQGDRPRRQNDRPRRNEGRRDNRDNRDRGDRQNYRGDRQNNNSRNLNNRNNQQRFDRNREEKPRRNNDREFDRNERRGNDRGNRSYNEDRNERRGNRNNYDRDFDRRENNRNSYDREDRRDRGERRQYKPRRQFAEKREDRGNRKPIQFSKLAELMPADDGLSLIVKVLSLDKVGAPGRTKYRCVIADNSGTAKAFLPGKIDVREGDSLALFNAKAEVVSEHIEIQLDFNGGRMELARREVEKINEDFNLSAKAWVPIE